MMESAMPGLLYPLQIDEVEAGDYFYTSYNTVAKVLSTEGNVIKMSDGNRLQVYELRPIRFGYLDMNDIDDENVIVTIVNFDREKHKYAHILQNRIRRVNAGIDIPICDARLASEGKVFLNFYK